jgi:pimeloyl-ACP methyl ester carboxylesterase
VATVTAKAPPTITARDGTVIYYKDWGSGQPVVFSHGRPLSADAWDDQLSFVASNGYRGVAPHGLTATHKDRFNADLLEFCRS